MWITKQKAILRWEKREQGRCVWIMWDSTFFKIWKAQFWGLHLLAGLPGLSKGNRFFIFFLQHRCPAMISLRSLVPHPGLHRHLCAFWIPRMSLAALTLLALTVLSWLHPLTGLEATWEWRLGIAVDEVHGLCLASKYFLSDSGSNVC